MERGGSGAVGSVAHSRRYNITNNGLLDDSIADAGNCSAAVLALSNMNYMQGVANGLEK